MPVTPILIHLDHPPIPTLDDGFPTADEVYYVYDESINSPLIMEDLILSGTIMTFVIEEATSLDAVVTTTLDMSNTMTESLIMTDTLFMILILRFVIFDDELQLQEELDSEITDGNDFNRVFDRIIPFRQIFFDALPEHYHTREKIMEFVDVFGEIFENFSGFVNDFQDATNIDKNTGVRLQQIGKLVGTDPADIAAFTDQSKRKFIRYQFITNRNKGLTRAVQNTLGSLGLNYAVERLLTKNYSDFVPQSSLISTAGWLFTRRVNIEFSSAQAIDNSLMMSPGILKLADKLLDKSVPFTLYYFLFYKLPIVSGVTYSPQFDPLLLVNFRVTSIFPLLNYFMDEPIPGNLDGVPTLLADASLGDPPLVGVLMDLGDGLVEITPTSENLNNPLLTDLAVTATQTISHVIYTLIVSKPVVITANELRLKTSDGDVFFIANFPSVVKDSSFAWTIEIKIPYSV